MAAACSQGGVGAQERVRELLRSRLEVLGPITAADLAKPLDLDPIVTATALAALEGEGFAVRGRFRSVQRKSPEAGQEEWCERGLLARIHRRTLKSLRRSIRPVSAAEFTSFLLVRHGLEGERVQGPESLRLALYRLEGCSAPASAWESIVLPARVGDFSPAMLDQVLASGEWLWKRAEPPTGKSAGRMAANIPICLLRREYQRYWPSVPRLLWSIFPSVR